VPEESCNTIPIILAGDFNIELKKNENETFVTDMEETFGLKLMSNPQCSTARSKSCIDMVFARNVDNLKCANYITYLQSHVWHSLRVYYDMMNTVQRKQFVDLVNNW
jgi:hypothetical protein